MSEMQATNRVWGQLGLIAGLSVGGIGLAVVGTGIWIFHHLPEDPIDHHLPEDPEIAKKLKFPEVKFTLMDRGQGTVTMEITEPTIFSIGWKDARYEDVAHTINSTEIRQVNCLTEPETNDAPRKVMCALARTMTDQKLISLETTEESLVPTVVELASLRNHEVKNDHGVYHISKSLRATKVAGSQIDCGLGEHQLQIYQPGITATFRLQFGAGNLGNIDAGKMRVKFPGWSTQFPNGRSGEKGVGAYRPTRKLKCRVQEYDSSYNLPPEEKVFPVEFPSLP